MQRANPFLRTVAVQDTQQPGEPTRGRQYVKGDYSHALICHLNSQQAFVPESVTISQRRENLCCLT